jgi:hypothetical protein
VLIYLQAHPGHKINFNKIHESEKSIRSNVIKIDKVLRQRSYTYEGRSPAPIPTVRPFRIRQKRINRLCRPITQKQQAGKRKKDFVVFANVQQAKGKLSKRL